MSHAPSTQQPLTADPHESGLIRYIQDLEEHFIAVRGRGVQWSAADSALAERWFYAGIELATIARLLAEAEESWRYHHADAALPQSLRWIQKAVMRAVGGDPAHRCVDDRGREDDRGSETARQLDSAAEDARQTEAALVQLQRQGQDLARSHPDPAVQDALRRANKRLARWRVQPPSGDILTALETMRQRIVARVLEGVGVVEADALQQTARSRLAGALGGRAHAAVLHFELACALDQAYGLPLPYWRGWQRPSESTADTVLIAPRPAPRAAPHAAPQAAPQAATYVSEHTA